MKKALRILTNKYLLTGVAFLAWMIYFDQNDWYSQRQRNKDLATTRANIAFLNGEIARMQQEHTALTSDPQKLEKFAREHFRMKRDNEDLYIIDKK
ncbi:MAG: septum formation initiator family protein [Flavipsychrobacter sp.]|nr:septum formation initiator family protein [Flavipsychrobacter sp.]